MNKKYIWISLKVVVLVGLCMFLFSNIQKAENPTEPVVSAPTQTAPTQPAPTQPAPTQPIPTQIVRDEAGEEEAQEDPTETKLLDMNKVAVEADQLKRVQPTQASNNNEQAPAEERIIIYDNNKEVRSITKAEIQEQQKIMEKGISDIMNEI